MLLRCPKPEAPALSHKMATVSIYIYMYMLAFVFVIYTRSTDTKQRFIHAAGYGDMSNPRTRREKKSGPMIGMSGIQSLVLYRNARCLETFSKKN